MSKMNAYLRFPDNTEEARKFYITLLGNEKGGGIFAQFSNVPATEGFLPREKKDEGKVIEIELPLPGGHVLIGSDLPESMVFKLNLANSFIKNHNRHTKSRVKYLTDALAVDGKIAVELRDIFWGPDYFSCTDKFGVQWMFVCEDRR